jgi:hypothetical protein
MKMSRGANSANDRLPPPSLFHEALNMHVTKTGGLLFSAVFSALLAAALGGCSSAPSSAGSGGPAGSGGAASSAATGGISGGSGGTSGAGRGGSSVGSGGAGTSAGGSGGASAGGSGGTSDSGGSGGATDAGIDTDSASSGGGAADPVAGIFPIPPGLTKIFDGTTLAGWDGDGRWTVNATEMAIQGKTGGGNLIKTKMDYGDFRLILTERMVLPGPSTNHLGECIWGGPYTAGNFGFSGCIVFIAPHGSLWDYGGGGNVFQGMGAGQKTDWQQIELLVIASTGQILAAVNGVQTTTFMRKAKGKPSPIGLQSHADHAGDTPGLVQYKDIYVESPPKSMTLLTVKH